jgi:LTXXQ motif family protein
MMRATKLLIVTLLAVVAAQAAPAQEGRHRMGREELRQRIEERFTAHAKEQLGLTDEQVTRLGETSRRFGGRRREIESRARAIREALGSQLRPGIAADRDSVTRLTDAALDLRIAYAETFRDELRETAKFLDPVQRAQLFTMRDRLLHHARDIRGKRWHHDWHRYRRRVAPPHSAPDSTL